jgi:hypothetical protein
MICVARPVLRRLLATTALLVASCSAWAQSAYNPPLWEVRSGESRVYLFGTIHVGKADFYPLPAAVQSAFEKSDTLALEVDPANEQEAIAAVMSSMYTPPDNVANHLDPALLQSVMNVSAGYGLQFEQLAQMKPYMLMLTLTNLEYAKLGYSAQQGLETHFSQRAGGEGKRIVSLESMLQQMQMLDQLSPQLQSAMLQITVDEISANEVAGLVDDMISAWRTGNVETLDSVLSIEEKRLPDALAAQFRQRFLTGRNHAMAGQIDNMLQNGERVFVAVGAMHMVGEEGLPALLAQKGYQVKAIR